MRVSSSSLIKTAASTNICIFCLQSSRRLSPSKFSQSSLRSFTTSTSTLQNADRLVKYHASRASNNDDVWETPQNRNQNPTRSPGRINRPSFSSPQQNQRATGESNNQQGKDGNRFRIRGLPNGSPRNPRNVQAREGASGAAGRSQVAASESQYVEIYDEELEPSADDSKRRRGVKNRSVKEIRKSEKFDFGNEEDESYRSAPVRRSKEKKAHKTSRREEKFATSDEDYAELELEAEQELNRKARREEKKRRQQERDKAAKAAQAKQIELPAYINLSNLATLLHARFEPFVQKLQELGFTDLGSEQFINFEDASLIAMEYGYSPNVVRGETEDLKPQPEVADKSLLPSRPPVVTIMGHVDHGKTTLLDYLRKSSVAAQEHGGITQHIGAFSVPMASGKTITFLDTPGHAAFLSMRQRGANVTDIVILVVAADDSVKPQTVEAIKHAKAANVPIIVAINKVDKEDADIEQVKQDLLRHDITVEDYSGDVQAYPVSGFTGQGLPDLVEAIDTQAEILDMRAEKSGPVEGWVLEASTKRAGRIATVLVRRGTLRAGDVIVAGTTWARVRTLKNEAGAVVVEAPPGHPVEVDGWRDQPEAGDEVLQAASEQKASAVVHFRETQQDQLQAVKDMEQIQETRKLEAERRAREKEEKALQKLRNKSGQPEPVEAEVDDGVVRAIPKPKQTEHQTLYFIVKADVSGSVEAVESSITSLPLANQPVSINILRSAVGQVSESDVDHAATVPAGQAYIVSFNQSIPPAIASDALRKGLTLLEETIIYKVIDAVRVAVEAKLPPIISKRVLGEAEALQAFDINVQKRQYMRVAGCRVRNGVVGKGRKVRIFRGGSPSLNNDENLIYEGTISTLKSHKKDVPEMRQGAECGMSFDKWEGFQAGDVIQCYEELSEPRRLT